MTDRLEDKKKNYCNAYSYTCVSINNDTGTVGHADCRTVVHADRGMYWYT